MIRLLIFRRIYICKSCLWSLMLAYAKLVYMGLGKEDDLGDVFSWFLGCSNIMRVFCLTAVLLAWEIALEDSNVPWGGIWTMLTEHPNSQNYESWVIPRSEIPFSFDYFFMLRCHVIELSLLLWFGLKEYFFFFLPAWDKTIKSLC